MSFLNIFIYRIIMIELTHKKSLFQIGKKYFAKRRKNLMRKHLFLPVYLLFHRFKSTNR